MVSKIAIYNSGAWAVLNLWAATWQPWGYINLFNLSVGILCAFTFAKGVKHL